MMIARATLMERRWYIDALLQVCFLSATLLCKTQVSICLLFT